VQGRRHRAASCFEHSVSFIVFLIAGLLASGAALDARGDANDRVAGKVVDVNGQAIAGAEVIVRSRHDGVERRTLTDPNGAFSVEHLVPGPYLVDARVARGARSTVYSVVVGETGSAALEIRIESALYQEQVVVTAEARPQPIDEVGKAITIVDDSEIAERDEYSVAESLRTVAGVQVRLDGGPGQLASLRIRGLRADASAVLIDGLRFRDATTTQGDASPFVSNLNVINLERAEVLRGSASSLYGTNAVGGAVNLVSRTGALQPGGELQLEGGQLGLLRVRGTFNGSAGDGRVRFGVGGLQLNVTDGVDGHDSTRSTGLQGAVTAQLRPGTTLWGRLWLSDDRVDLNTSPSAFETPVSNLGNGPVVPARPLDQGQVDRLAQGQPVDFGSATYVPGIDDPDDDRGSSFWTGALRLTQQWGRDVSLEGQYQHLHSDRRYTNRPGGSGFQPFVTSQSDYTGAIDTFQVLATRGLGASVLVSAGYEFERESYDGRQQELSGAPDAFEAGTRVSQDAHALMARASLEPDSRARIAGSVRLQGFRLSSPRFSPDGTSSGYDGIAFDAPPTAVTGDLAVSSSVGARDTKLRLHVGNAYRAPSLYERFGGGFSADPSTGIVGFTPYGDPQLEPDRYVSLDAGIEQPLARGRGRVAATWFHTWVDQLTEFDFSGGFDPATDPYGRFVGYINGDGGRSRGLEIEGGWRAQSVRVTSAYTWTDSKTDKALLAPGFFRTPAVAAHTFAATVVGHVGDRVEIVGDVFARSATYAALFTQNGSLAYEFPAMMKVDLVGAYTWRLGGRRQVRAYGKVDNLFDRRYYELGWLAPGATALVGVTLQY